VAAPDQDFGWLSFLVTSVEEAAPYRAETRGAWPASLRGTLFRNGPSLFERDGVRKRTLGDGDGMIRAYDIEDGEVHFRSRFIQTTKYRAEQAAGRYLYPTWSTRAPGWLANVGRKRRSQAEENVVLRHGQLLAFDEVGLPWALDPATLETTSRYQIGATGNWPAFLTHTKTDPFNGHWTVVGGEYHRPDHVRIVIEDSQGFVRTDRRVVLPRRTYVHDFFATPHYLVFGLNAVVLRPLKAALGLEPLIRALKWRPEIGNLAFVVPKNGDDPFTVEAPTAWCIHTINAYEVGHEIICDFVGFDDPGYLLDEDGAFSAIMEGRVRTDSPAGTLARWRIDTRTTTLTADTSDTTSDGLPHAEPLRHGQPYACAYLAAARPGQWWPSGIARVDVETGERDHYEGRTTQVFGEPLFVPRQGGATDEGWVLVESSDGAEGIATLNLFDANSIAAGPIAEARLRHAMPTSFHGAWVDRH